MKLALITGISGQDGSYLSNFLIKKNYKVVGLDRRSSRNQNWRLDYFGITDKVIIEYSDLLEEASLFKLFKKYNFDEVYNLSALSYVANSFEVPITTTNVNSLGTLKLLEIIRTIKKKIKFYQASTSEMFGNTPKLPQNETTPFNPVSPYGISKLYSYHISKNYRNAYGMFICNGILFNHESPLRSQEFVTKKITLGLKKIKEGKINYLSLGNIYSKRDWGFAGDYVEAIWKMMQKKKSDDYIISTGEQYTVKNFINEAAKYYDFKLVWRGKGCNEKAYDKITKKIIIRIDKKYYRPLEVYNLMGDYSKAKKLLKWKPKTSFKSLVKLMCDYENNKY